MAETTFAAVAKLAELLSASLGDGSFVGLTLTQPNTPSIAPRRVTVRLVELADGNFLQITRHELRRDVTKNIPPSEASNWLRHQVPVAFRSVVLATTKRDWQLVCKPTGKQQLVSHKPARTAAPSREHDRPKAARLDSTAHEWLAGLGVLDKSGKVRASMADKYRQINRYLEIFSHLTKDCPCSTVADMGCGKGYLTFGMWHLLRGRNPRIIGIEQRSELVAATNELARRIGAAGLEFRTGTITSAPLPRLDALIALHACDTATDDAIVRGIRLGAKLIIVAPCCHQQVRPQLGRPAPLAEVLAHGIMSERLAEWATDGLRALCLQWAGYRTTLIEFVGGEHTPKNLMIAGTLESTPFVSDERRERIARFKSFFGIQHHALDELGHR
jgi:SAM-dependent methyltransferase